MSSGPVKSSTIMTSTSRPAASMGVSANDQSNQLPQGSANPLYSAFSSPWHPGNEDSTRSHILSNGSAPGEALPTPLQIQKAQAAFNGDVAQPLAPRSNPSPSHISSDTQPTTASSNITAAHKKEHRHMWSAEETDALVAGCTKHGVGNWKAILNDPDLHSHFSAERHPGDLKDRFRTKFPEAYHELYPNAKTHVTEKASRKVSEGSKSHFEKGKNKERRCFTPAEDAVLKKGYDIHGSSWTVIAKDPVFEGRRKPTDLRDRFRNAFPELYEQAGYKPRLKGGKSKDRRLSHGSSHVPHSHHGHAVPLPDKTANANADLDSVIVAGPDGRPTFARSSSSLSSNAPMSGAEDSKVFSATSASSEANSDIEAVGHDSSGSILFDKLWIEAALGNSDRSNTAHRHDSSAQSDVSSASGLPEMVRSLSFGSGMSAASNQNRPPYNTQFSLPSGASTFAQAIESGLVPEHAVGNGHINTHAKGASEQDERARMAQWHLQQAHLLQQQAQAEAARAASTSSPSSGHGAAFAAHQQHAPPHGPVRSQSQIRSRTASRLGLGAVQATIQSSLRRSQSSKRAHSSSARGSEPGSSNASRSGHAPSASTSNALADPSTGSFEDWAGHLQRSGILSAPSGQSQSLPPSQAPPADFAPNNLDISIDDAQLQQINELLQSHAADRERQAMGQDLGIMNGSPSAPGSAGAQSTSFQHSSFSGSAIKDDSAIDFGVRMQNVGPYAQPNQMHGFLGGDLSPSGPVHHAGDGSGSNHGSSFVDYRGSESDTGTDASGSISNSNSRAPSSIGFTGGFPGFGQGFPLPAMGPPSERAVSSNGSAEDEDERIDEDGYDEDEEDDDEDLDGGAVDANDRMPRSDTIQPRRMPDAGDLRDAAPLGTSTLFGEGRAEEDLNAGRSYFSDTEHPNVYRAHLGYGPEDSSLSQTLMSSFAPSPSLRRPRSTDTLRQVMPSGSDLPGLGDLGSSFGYLRSVGEEGDDEVGNGTQQRRSASDSYRAPSLYSAPGSSLRFAVDDDGEPDDASPNKDDNGGGGDDSGVYAESLPDLSSFSSLDGVFGNDGQQAYSFDDLDLSALLRAQDTPSSPGFSSGHVGGGSGNAGATPSLRHAEPYSSPTKNEEAHGQQTSSTSWAAGLDLAGQDASSWPSEDGQDRRRDVSH